MEHNQKPNEVKKIDGAIAVVKNGTTEIHKDAKSGGVLIGKAHSDEGGGIQATVVEDNRKILIEAGEVIINKHAAKKHWRKLNEINQSAGNGAAIHEPQFAKGATIESLNSEITDFINKNESVLKSGYVSTKKRSAKHNSITIISYNSGQSRDMGVINTVNSSVLVKTLASHLSIDNQVSAMIVASHIGKAKRLTLKDIENVKSDDFVIIDRDSIACHFNSKERFDNGATIDKGGKNVYVNASHEDMNEYTLFIKKQIESEGYYVSSPSYSKTKFGNSNYLYVDTEELGNRVKVRVSDHSVTNLDRMFDEIHLHYPPYSGFLGSIENLIKQIRFRLQKDKYFKDEDGVEEYIVKMDVNEKDLRQTDKILLERLSTGRRGAGRKIFAIERINKKQVVNSIYNTDNKIFRTKDKFENGGGVDLVDSINEGKTYIVSALRKDGRRQVKIFKKEVSNLDVYNYFKDELNIEIVDSSIDVQEHSGFDAVLFLRAVNELCLDLFGSEIKDSEELIFSFDKVNLQVYDFSCTLEDNTVVDIEMNYGDIIVKKKETNKFLYGGGIDFYENKFTDIGYKWKISTEDAYKLCDSNKSINLDELIEHKDFFLKYPLASRVKVYFEGLLDDEIEADSCINYNGTAYHFSEIIIKINKLHYTQNGKEKHTIHTGIAEHSKECCLLHEIQHICQQGDRKPVGRGHKEIYDRFVDEGRVGRVEVLRFAAFIEYKIHPSEQEAMKAVYFWLNDIGSKYTDPKYINWNYGNEKEQSESQNMYAKGGGLESYKKVQYIGDNRAFWYVVDENDDVYTLVFEEKLEHWQNATPIERQEYIEELEHKFEMEAYVSANDIDNDDVKFLHGGKISQKKYSYIDDTYYTWRYNQIALYALYKGDDACDLDCLIEHPVLFEKYKGIGKVKVLFFNGDKNKAEVEIPKTLNIIENFDEIIIRITLNFKYYEDNYREFRTIESNEPDLARESILLHELQHILQALHNRPSGTSYVRASKKANARIATLRANEKAKRITEEDYKYLVFYESLSENALYNYFYYNDDGELEARKAVRKWLKGKGIRYVDPLTEEFGIPIIDVDSFAKGGGTSIQKTNLDNRIVSKWSDIPAIWKKTQNFQRISINSFDPKDKAIQKIASVFCGKDELRPVMSGVFFDEFGFVATDAHKLFFKQGKHLLRGIYPVSKIKNDKVTLTKKGLIDGNYPRYQQIVPTKTDIVCEIDVLKLYTYVTACKNYESGVTHQINFAYGKDKVYAYNSEYLSGVLETFLELGETTIYAGFTESEVRAVIFSPDSDVAKKPHEAFSKKDSILALLMPVMAHDDFKGATDLLSDRNNQEVFNSRTENSCYFDFKDNEIHNEDGSIVSLNEDEELYPSYINSKAISLVKVFTEMNHYIPMLDSAVIKNGTLHATDNELEASMSVSTELEDGTYYYLDKYLRKGEVEVDEYPNRLELGGKNGKKKNVAIISLHEFLEQLKYANLFIQKNDFRPALECVNLIFSKGKMQIISTDAQCMYKNEISAECQLEKEIIAMVSPKVVAKILSIFDDQPLVINCDDRRVSITGCDFEIIARKSDDKYPDISSLIPYSSKTLIEIQTEDLLIPTDKSGKSKLIFVGSTLKIGEEIFKGRYKIHALSEPKIIDQTRGIYIGSVTKLKERLSKINSSSIDIYVSDKKGFDDSNLLWIPLSETKSVSKVKTIIEQPVKIIEVEPKQFSQSEIIEVWSELLELAEMMLETYNLSRAEGIAWREQKELAELMLN